MIRAELLTAADKNSHLESTFKLIQMGFDGNAEHCLALIDIFIQCYHQG